MCKVKVKVTVVFMLYVLLLSVWKLEALLAFSGVAC